MKSQYNLSKPTKLPKFKYKDTYSISKDFLIQNEDNHWASPTSKGMELIAQYYNKKYKSSIILSSNQLDPNEATKPKSYTSLITFAAFINKYIDPIRKNGKDCRVAFLIGAEATHATPIIYIKENGEEGFLYADSKNVNTWAADIINKETGIHVYAIEKTRQSDMYSCFVDALIFNKDATAFNDETQEYQIPNLLAFLKNHSEPAEQGSYSKVIQLPPELLKTSQSSAFTQDFKYGYRRVFMLEENIPTPPNIDKNSILLRCEQDNLIAYWNDSGDIISKNLPIDAVKEILTLINPGNESSDRNLIKLIIEKFRPYRDNPDKIIHKHQKKDENHQQFMERYSESVLIEKPEQKAEQKNISKYLRKKGIKTADIIEIQFYINVFAAILGDNFTDEARTKFIEGAKKEFSKQPAVYENRNGLHSYAEEFFNQLNPANQQIKTPAVHQQGLFSTTKNKVSNDIGTATHIALVDVYGQLGNLKAKAKTLGERGYKEKEQYMLNIIEIMDKQLKTFSSVPQQNQVTEFIGASEKLINKAMPVLNTSTTNDFITLLASIIDVCTFFLTTKLIDTSKLYTNTAEVMMGMKRSLRNLRASMNQEESSVITKPLKL